MLPPVLEIYVLWHPDDHAGSEAASQIFDHFHGTIFSGLIGGAIEVFVRSEGWSDHADSPRPIPFSSDPPPNGIPASKITVIVPIIGNELALAVASGDGPWHTYLANLMAMRNSMSEWVGIFPLVVDQDAMLDTTLGKLFHNCLPIAAVSSFAEPEPAAELRCRDLAQGITQLILGANTRLTIFVSHTKHEQSSDEHVRELISLVRSIISDTRLRHFFDANDLQPGEDWDAELRSQASSSALLALRTDLYATREWCQREMLLAKRHGMPVVILEALFAGEERGSFLMDHVPRIPVREDEGIWRKADVRRGLNIIVDECLKRSLWHLQKELAKTRSDLNIDWWASHTPEPVTLANWISEQKGREEGKQGLRIMHPDPPMGPEEKLALEQIASLSGYKGTIDILTPRTLAARGA
jgi:hypothetical protein